MRSFIVRVNTLSVLVSTMITKTWLIWKTFYLPPESNPFASIIQIPSLYIPDLLILMICWMTMLGLDRFGSKFQRFGKIYLYLFSFLMLFVYFIVDWANLGYLSAVTDLIDWKTVVRFLDDIDFGVQLMKIDIATLYLWALFHMAIYILSSLAYYKWLGPKDNYLPLLPPLNEPVMNKIKLWRRRGCITLIFVALYYLWASFTQSYGGNWGILSQSLILKPLDIFKSKSKPKVLSRDFRVETYEQATFQNCLTIKSSWEAILAGKAGNSTCEPLDPPVFDFLQRNDSSSIRNVVWIVLESARNDILPFKEDYMWAKKNVLNPEEFKVNPISKFLESLITKGLYFSDARTVSTLSVKSGTSNFCSSLPILQNMLLESRGTPYTPCLPNLLNTHYWDTLFFTPSTTDWDSYNMTLKAIGFKNIIDCEIWESPNKEGIDKLLLNFTKVNPMGYDDMPMIEPTIKWMKERREKGIPSFVTLATNVNHDPNNLPLIGENSTYRRYLSSFLNHLENRYLNTARYTDLFLEQLFKEFEQNNFMNDTLFVIVGDHGFSLGEKGRFGTSSNYREEQIKVPLLFYSENTEWRKRYPPKEFSHTVSTLDILPTLLEMLADTPTPNVTNLENYYEGFNLLGDQRHPVFFTNVNPGAYATVYKEGDYKFAFRGVEEDFYNLAMDPMELYGRNARYMEGEKDDWANKLRLMQAVYYKRISTLWNVTI